MVLEVEPITLGNRSPGIKKIPEARVSLEDSPLKMDFKKLALTSSVLANRKEPRKVPKLVATVESFKLEKKDGLESVRSEKNVVNVNHKIK